MIDNHVHIGWFSDGYHYPIDVWNAEREAGVDDIVVSSTSTCAELYKLVVHEIKDIMSIGGSHIHPLLWLTPKMMKTWGLSYMLHSKIRWQGVKMHWQAHREWFYRPKLVKQAMMVVQRLNVPLLLHTGEFKECTPNVFENLIKNYPNVTFVLAHGRPLELTLPILQYNNVYVDTAFMPVENISKLVDMGYAKRTLWGTDAPINLIAHPEIATSEYIANVIRDTKKSIGENLFNIISTNTVYKPL